MSIAQRIRAALGIRGSREWADIAHTITADEQRAALEAWPRAKPKRAGLSSGSAKIDMRQLWREWEGEWLDGDRDESGNIKVRPALVTRRNDVPVVMRGRRRDSLPPAFLAEVEWDADAEPQGWSGQDFTAGLPINDAQPEQKPYLIRGRGVNIGTAMQLYRGDPTVAEGVQTILDYVRMGRAEFSVPEELRDIAPETRAAAGISLDQMQRVCDELNAELAVNRAVYGDGQFTQMLMLSLVCGFSLYEFGFDLSAPVTRRTRFLEQRHPRSVDDWILDSRGRPVGFTQTTPQDGARGRGGRRTAQVVDLRRCVHAVNMRDGWNPEGFPMLRPAWYWHKFGMEWSDTALMHRMKFGAGLPVFKINDATLQGDEMSEALRSAAANHYASVDSYIALPPGVEFDVRTIAAEQGWEAVMRYVREQKRACLGMGVLGLGENATGSYALADVRSQMLMRRLNGMVEGVEAAWDHYAARYCEAFHGSMPITPRFQITGLLQRSFDEVMNARERVTVWERQASPTLEERNDIRAEAGMPLLEPDDVADEAEAAQDAHEPTPDAPQVRHASHAHGEGCGCVTRALTSTKREPLSRGRFRVEARDGAFRCYRPLEPLERHVAFRNLAFGYRDWQAEIVAALDGVAKRYRDAFVEVVRPLIEAGDLTALASVDVPGDWPAQYRDAIDDILASVAEWAAADMRDEIASQVGDEWTASPESSGPSFAELVTSQVALIANQVHRYWSSRLEGFALATAQAGPGGQISQVSRATLPPATAAGWAAGAVGTTVNASREVVASEEGPRITMVQRSEVMDENTCEPCQEIDGERMRFGSARYEEIKGPYHLCESLASGNNRCRGIDIYEFGTSG